MEEVFLQYGALGACMLLFMGFFYRYYTDSKVFQEKISNLVENNTIALTKVYEVISHCPKVKQNI